MLVKKQRRRANASQVLQTARAYQAKYRRRGTISITQDRSQGLITLHAKVGGKTQGRVLELKDRDINAGTVSIGRMIAAFVRRLPPRKVLKER